MFWPRFLRLVVSVVLEGLHFLANAALFPLRRRQARQEILALLGRARPRTVLMSLVLAVSLSAGGCHTFTGSSFEQQIDHTVWTLETLADQRGWQGHLVHDLQVIFDPELGELGWTFSMLGW